MKPKTCIFAVLALAVVGVLAWLALAPVERPAPKAKAAEKVERKAEGKAKRVKDVAKAKPRPAATNGTVQTEAQVPVTDWIDELTGKDKEIARKVSDALDEEDLATIKGLVRDAAASRNTEVRQQMVDALGWFDTKAIADLTLFLADPDADVAQSAFNHWDSAVDMVDDESFKVTVAKDAMKSLKDPDMLENVSSKLKAAEDEGAAVDAVVDILRNVKEDSAAAKIAKESYEFITGEEFKSLSEATLWKIKRDQEKKEEGQ